MSQYGIPHGSSRLGQAIGSVGSPSLRSTTGQSGAPAGNPAASPAADPKTAKHNASFLKRPEVRAAMMQFGVSLLSPGSNFGTALGDAVGAVGRYSTQQQQRAASQAKLQQEQEQKAYDREQDRISNKRLDAEEARKADIFDHKRSQRESVAAARDASTNYTKKLTEQLTATLQRDAKPQTTILTPEERDADPRFANLAGSDIIVALDNMDNPSYYDPPSRDTDKLAQKEYYIFKQLTEVEGVDPKEALVTASRMARELIPVSINPQTGAAEVIDEISAVASGQGALSVVEPSVPQVDLKSLPERGPGLWDVADTGTGLLSEALLKTAGIPGTDLSREEMQAAYGQRRFETFSNDIARLKSENPRFPVAEVTRVLEAIKTDPGIFRTPSLMKVNLIALNDSINNSIRKYQINQGSYDITAKTRRSNQAMKNYLLEAQKELNLPEILKRGTPLTVDLVNASDADDIPFLVNLILTDDELNALTPEVEQALALKLTRAE